MHVILRSVGTATRRLASASHIQEAQRHHSSRTSSILLPISRNTLPSASLLHSHQHSQRRLFSTTPGAASELDLGSDDNEMYDETKGPRKFSPEERKAYKVERKARMALQKQEKKDKRSKNKRGIDWATDAVEFKVGIVGRPNVGKSSIFNAMVRRNAALVNAIPGTTRDRKEGWGQMGELKFQVIDTGGLEDKDGPSSAFDMGNTGLVQEMLTQVEYALDEVDVCLFVVDSIAGVTRDDEYFARWLRKRQYRDGRKLPICLIANKAEGLGGSFEWGHSDPRWDVLIADCYRLGFGDPVPMSAAHRLGISDLYSVLEPYGRLSEKGRALEGNSADITITEAQEDVTEATDVVVDVEAVAIESGDDIQSENVISAADDKGEVVPRSGDKKERFFGVRETDEEIVTITIVGRTNVGKSTLLNHLTGKARCITGPLAGLTRDAIKVEWEYEGRKINLVDTAGMRKRGRLYEAAKQADTYSRGENSKLPGKAEQALLEGLSIHKSLQAISMSHVVLMVVDLERSFDLKGQETLSMTGHDISIISKVMDEGRSMVVVVNKCDLTIPKDVVHVKEAEAYIRGRIEDSLATSVPMARGVPIVPISAMTGFGVEALMPTVLKTFERWSMRTNTNKLNKFIAAAQAKRSAPLKALNIRQRNVGSDAHHKLVPVRIKFITQVGIRPPTFAVHLNRINSKDALPPQYIQYLTSSLRKEFGLDGIPVRFVIKASHNPYSGAGQGTKEHSAHIRTKHLQMVARERAEEYKEILRRRATPDQGDAEKKNRYAR